MIVTANPQQQFTDNIQNLTNTAIAIIKPHHYYQAIKKQYPEAQLLPQNALEQGVDKLIKGHADILLCPLITCSYIINKKSANHLNVIG